MVPSDSAGKPGLEGAPGLCMREPQLRQKFIPGGFTAAQLGHRRPGNPAAGWGVGLAGFAAVCAANLDPQPRQKIDPGGLSRPQLEHLSISSP